jgi:hypothetical protein
MIRGLFTIEIRFAFLEESGHAFYRLIAEGIIKEIIKQ